MISASYLIPAGFLQMATLRLRLVELDPAKLQNASR